MSLDTTKIDEWTLGECRDWLAQQVGWVAPGKGSGERSHISCWHRIYTSNNELRMDTRKWDEHPIPATLDEAAKLLDEWFYTFVKQWFNDPCTARAQHRITGNFLAATGDNELLARFRLRCKVESLGGLK